MKRFITVIVLCTFVMFMFSGCSKIEALMESSDRFSSKEKQRAYLFDRYEEIINLINDDDAKGLKSLFSEKALDRTDDIDESIEYLIGNFDDLEIAEDDVRWADITETRPYVYHIFSCSIAVKTSKGDMTLGLYDIPMMQADESFEGLYSLVLFGEDDFHHYFAGVFSPEKTDIAHKVDFINANGLRKNNTDRYLEDNLTAELLNELDHDETDALGYFLAIHPKQGLKWTIKDGDIRYLFVEFTSYYRHFILCVGISENDPDRICHASCLEYESGDVPTNNKVINAGLDDIVDFCEEHK